LIKFKEEKIKVDPKKLIYNINENIAGILDIDIKSEEYNNLVFSIKRQGQLEPVLIYKDKLVDGRHRCYACMHLKIPVIANVIDSSVSITEVEEYITSKEMQHKKLTPTQRTIIAYERFVENKGYNKSKTSKIANVRREALVNYEYIKTNEYAIKNDYIRILKMGEAVKLPNGRYSASLQTIKNALRKHEEDQLAVEDASLEVEKPLLDVDYVRVFADYDIEDKAANIFWYIKDNFAIDTKASIKLIYKLLLSIYPDKYTEDTLNIEELNKTAKV